MQHDSTQQEPAPHGCLTLNRTQQLAFQHCLQCEPTGGNNFRVKCAICDWGGTTNDSKMMWCHYLRVSSQQGAKCIPLEELEEQYPDYVAQLRALKASKKKRSASDNRPVHMITTPAAAAMQHELSTHPKKQRIDHMVQQRAVNETSVREAWDKVFFKCVSFGLADDPDFRHAVKMTSFCKGFKINCSRVIRTKRLLAQDAKNKQWLEARLSRVAYLGSSIHSDGWKSKRKKKYHNFIILTPDGPAFITMHDVTGNSGTGAAIAEEFELVINSLAPAVRASLLIGLTDTPSANRTAWNLLEEKFPGTIWAGCMAHEISLLFKDYKKHIPELGALFREGLDVIQWVNNHDDILKIFRKLVAEHFKNHARAAQKGQMGLYQPGDTRMALLYVMLDRLVELKPVLEALVHYVSSDGTPSYDAVAQKALLAYNKRCTDPDKAHKKVQGSSTKLQDKYKVTVKNDGFWKLAEEFLKLAKTPFLLLRLVDTNLPTLSKVYYSCCLVDKVLRIEKAKGSELAGKMHKLFLKRWDRWHRPLHTAAYAFDPAYQDHVLTEIEVQEVESVVQKMYPSEWLTVMAQWKDFKGRQGTVFTDEVPSGSQSIWGMVDKVPSWKWWDSVPKRNNSSAACKAGIQLTARCAAASCCEFNWSDLDDIIGKKRTALKTETIEMLVRNRAVMRLKKSLKANDPCLTLPTLDDAIASITGDAQESAVGLSEADDDNEESDDSDEESDDDDSGSED